MHLLVIPRLRVAYVRDTLVDVCVSVLVIPSTCIRGRDIVVTLLVIPSTCIRERDIVVTLLVRVCVCVSVCLHLIAS